MDGKTIAIIAHIPIIGFIISWLLNMDRRDEFASFYNRQLAGLNILLISGILIPIVGWLFSLFILVLMVVSLTGVFKGEEKLTPYIGIYFQDWFKSL